MKDLDLTRYEADRDLAADLLKAVREMKAGRLHVVLSPGAEVRENAGLSQSQFATPLGGSVRTPEGWEQGNNQPNGVARTLLAIASTNPKTL